jgi:hypothetical protein
LGVYLLMQEYAQLYVVRTRVVCGGVKYRK